MVCRPHPYPPHPCPLMRSKHQNGVHPSLLLSPPLLTHSPLSDRESKTAPCFPHHLSTSPVTTIPPNWSRVCVFGAPPALSPTPCPTSLLPLPGPPSLCPPSHPARRDPGGQALGYKAAGVMGWRWEVWDSCSLSYWVSIGTRWSINNYYRPSKNIVMNYRFFIDLEGLQKPQKNDFGNLRKTIFVFKKRF